jgi:hypothetical protein
VRTIVTENPRGDVRRYLRHWTSRAFVEGKLAEKHPGLPKEQRRRKARDISVCVQQGLEYLHAGDAGSMLTTPLPLFYASENLAKATCVFLDPSLGADSFKSHGLTRDRLKRRTIRTLSAGILKPGSDVWSRYLQLGNTERCAIEVKVNGKTTTRDFVVTFEPGVTSGHKLQLGHLLRLLPDLVEDVRNAGWGSSYSVHVPHYEIVNAPGGTASIALTVRHGNHEATRDLVRSTAGAKLEGFTAVRDEHDVIEYRRDGITTVILPLRADMFGELFVELNRGPVDLAEPLVLFASLFIMSSATRYDPEQWQRLLERSPGEAILVDRMLEVAGRKLPNIALNTLEGEVMQFRLTP